MLFYYYFTHLKILFHIILKASCSLKYISIKHQNTACCVSHHKALGVDMFKWMAVFKSSQSKDKESSANPRLPVVSLPSSGVSFSQGREGCQVWTGPWQVLLPLLSLSFSRTRGFRDAIRSHENAVSRVAVEIVAAADRTVILTLK